MNKLQVFTGAFADEPSQRFLRAYAFAVDHAFAELTRRCMPSNPKRFLECLDRVRTWDTSVCKEEHAASKAAFEDVDDLFKHVFCEYVRSMRGGGKLKIIVSVPNFETVLHRALTRMASQTCMRAGRYFDSTRTNLIEQRLVCMDCLRDAMFDFIGDDYVQLEDKSVVSVSRAESDAAVPIPPPPPSTMYDAPEPREEASSEAGSKVVSNVFERGSTLPPSPNQMSASAAPEERLDDDDESLVGPDDSVSNADFTTKQQASIQRYISRQREMQERSARAEAEREDDQESRCSSKISKSSRSSRTSVSLSSVSISQGGTFQPRLAPQPEELSVHDDASHASSSSQRSEWRNQFKIHKGGGSSRSYITQLTEE